MSRKSYARTALYVVQTPEEFCPDRPWTVPDAFSDAKLYMKNLSVHEARRFCRLFNERQVQLYCKHQWDRTWMIVSSCCRQSRKWDESTPAAEKVGAE